MPTAQDKCAGVCLGGINTHITRLYSFTAFTDAC